MFNIFRSVNYTVRRDITVLISLFTIIFFPVFTYIFNSDGGNLKFKDITGNMYYMLTMEGYIFLMLIMLLITCRIMGSDMSDKTINFEILYGQKKMNIYGARVICVLIWSVLLVTILYAYPVIMFSIINGFGEGIKEKDMVIRYMLSILPSIRIVSFLILFTCVLGSAGKAIALGYVLVEGAVILGSILQEFDVKSTYIFGIMNELAVFNAAESLKKTAPFTIIVSIVMTLIYLIIGYYIFSKKEGE